MNTIKQRAHRYAVAHQHKADGISLMRAYVAGATEERELGKSTLRFHEIKVFISGKISGEDYYKAYHKFSEAEKHLESIGYKVINPMVLCKKKWSWLHCMIICLYHLCRCKCLLQLPDWRKSRGARIEYRIASLLNKDILHGN